MQSARVVQYQCRACNTVHPTWVSPCPVCVAQSPENPQAGFQTLQPIAGEHIPTGNGIVQGTNLSSRKVAEPIRSVQGGVPLQIGAGRPGAHQSARLLSVGGVPVAGAPGAPLVPAVIQPQLAPQAPVDNSAAIAAAIAKLNGGGAPPASVPGANGGSAMGMVPPPAPPPKIALPVTEALEKEEERYPTGIQAFDALLGGGFPLGCSIMISGQPGVGKSTIILQVLAGLAKTLDEDVLDATAEETRRQVMQRARRIGARVPRLYVARCLSDKEVLAAVAEVQPRVLVIDSVQTVIGEEGMGEIASAKHIAQVWDEWAKAYGRIVIFLSQVTKDDNFAGARKIEHLVDAHYAFEEVKRDVARLTARKNRFGPRLEHTWHMTARGMYAEPPHYEHAFNEEIVPKEAIAGGAWALGEYCKTCKVGVAADTKARGEEFKAFLKSQEAVAP
jgi:KaiC/GvpD/RAD55 family RecA-like ATPase